MGTPIVYDKKAATVERLRAELEAAEAELDQY